jgi:serine/threonine-protein kinase RsbW
MIQGPLSTCGSGPGMMTALQKRAEMAAMANANTMPTNARRLRLCGDLAELERLAVWIEDWAAMELSADLLFAVQVCLEEAVANVIMYSGARPNHLDIAIEVDRKGHTVIARVEDNGSVFDPTQIPSQPFPISLMAAKAGGFGIRLMRSFAAGMHYERGGGDSNRLTMWFFDGPQER